ncbi:hypothetical protein DLH72_04050 [Candidatus Gracilibacteria bacterium]|nr:MAG: hypothetical protein DLH72_04050 [Candidatus Gracilibacteria bacterium]
MKITKEKYLKEFRERNPSFSGYSDEEILEKAKEKRPDLEFLESKGYLQETGEKILKGVGNLATDTINVVGGGISRNLLGIDRENVKLFDYQKEDPNFSGGFTQKIADNVSDAFSTSFKATEERTKRRNEERKHNPGNIFTESLQDFGDLGRTAFDIGGNLFKAGADSIGDIVMSAGDTLIPDETQEDIKKYVAEQVQESETLTGIVDWFKDYQETLEYMKKNAPEDYATHRASIGFMEGVADLITAKVGSVAGKGIKNGFNSSIEISKNVINKAKSTIEKLNPLKEKYLGKSDMDLSDTLKFSKENVDAVSPVTGAKFEVEKTPGIYDNITDKIFGSTDNEELAIKSIFPKMTKEKGTQAKLEAGKRALEGVEQLYDDFANGIVKSDIHDMRGAVEGVDEALEHWGKKIGDLTDSSVEIDFTPDLADLKKDLGVKTALFSSKVHKFGKDLLNTFDEIGNKLTVKETQETLSNIKAELFSSTEILNTFTKSSAGRKVLNFIDNLQNKLDNTIEKTAGNSEEFIKARKNYSKYKKIQKDLLDSYLVDVRNSNKGLAGMAGQLGGAYEILQNPLNAGNIAKGLAFKHIGALVGKSKTRSGNWEKLIRNLDRKAVKDSKFKVDGEAKHYTNVDSSIYKNISEVEAEKMVKKYFGDEVGVEFLENITTPQGLEALGRYKDKLISFAKNPKENVVEHEVLHAYFDLALTKTEKANILEKIKVEKNFKDLLDAEEFLADSFADFVIGRKNVTGISDNLKKFIGDLVFKFKQFFGKEDKFEALFRDLEDIGRGKNKFKVRSNGEIGGEGKFLIDNSNIWLQNINAKLNDLAEEGSIDLSGIKLSDNEFLNNLKIFAKINGSIDKKYKNTSGNFIMTPFMRKVYKEKSKFIKNYRKYINSGIIEGRYFWDIHNNKPSIIFEIDNEKIMFHLPIDSYLVPQKIKERIKK